MDGKKKTRKKKGNQHKVTEDAASKVAVQESNNGDVEENQITDNSTNVDTQSHGVSESDMEDAKKKNDKSKGNRPKFEDATPKSEKLVVHESSNGFAPQENHNMNNSTPLDIQSFGVCESDTEHDKHKMHEENIAKLQEKVMQLEKERTLWLQKQVFLEEKIKLLQEEVDLHAQKGAVLDEKVQHLEIENDKLIRNKAIVEDKITNVESIRDSLLLTEVLLKERITGVEEASVALDMQVKELDGSRNSVLESNQQLLERVIGLESRIQSLEERVISHESLPKNKIKVCLEEKTKLLQEEADLHAQKGEKVQHLEIENDKLIRNKVIFEDEITNVESIRDSLLLTEVLLKERITGVEEAGVALDMQVKELDGSRNSVLELNQQLLARVIGLESRIQSLEDRAISHESLPENMIKLPEDAFSVRNAEVIKLLADEKSKTPEFYEKIDGSNLESAKSEHSTHADLDHTETLDRNYASPASRSIPELSEEKTKSSEDGQSMQLLDKLVAKDGANGLVSEIVGFPPQLDAPRISEVAAIPFDEIQIHEDSTKAVKISDGPEAVPFSDAPLVGAPFRLISFVAKYVSGADLVKQNSSRSDR